jgi:hypothetical protein
MREQYTHFEVVAFTYRTLYIMPVYTLTGSLGMINDGMLRSDFSQMHRITVS